MLVVMRYCCYEWFLLYTWLLLCRYLLLYVQEEWLTLLIALLKVTIEQLELGSAEKEKQAGPSQSQPDYFTRYDADKIPSQDKYVYKSFNPSNSVFSIVSSSILSIVYSVFNSIVHAFG